MIAILAAAVAAASPPLVTQYHDLALSPLGERTATVEVIATGEEPRDPHETVVVRSVKDGSVLHRIDPCATCRYYAPAWSPHGDRLAFVMRDDNTGQATLEVFDGANLTAMASYKGEGGLPRWSPDGASLAFLATVGARKKTGATEAGAPLTGEIGSQPDEQRIAIVPAGGGEMRFASPADTFVYEYDWTPDGRGFVATAAKGDGDNNWWVAKLEAFDAATGAERVIAAPKMQMNNPRVSADGKTVYVIGGLMSDFGPIGGDLWSVPFSGGELVDRTPGFKGSFTSLAMRGKTLAATALVDDRTEIGVFTQRRGFVAMASEPGAAATAFNGKVSFSADGAFAATVVEDFAHPPEISLLYTAGAPPEPAPPLQIGWKVRPFTHENSQLGPYVAATSVHWKNGGFDVQGWLLGPMNLEPGKTYPMIVEVHGGPSSAHRPGYVSHGTALDLVQHGYFVFRPNPRGSYGQGEAFTRANMRDFGGGDLSDILAGVDAVEKVAPIDDRRLGLLGHSYGGLMTMWGVTHTDRFHAAVAGAGIANWISYYGQNGIDQWMIPFFGASAYDDPAIYDKLSPIRYIKAAKTPTFMYVGERDVECPPAQSLEFWHGLKEVGVPTSLVIYPGEGHGIRDPQHVLDLERRIVGWFDKYLGS
jgi:dipeptidyl aminopeptidase/acylaminoacyl peptidase